MKLIGKVILNYRITSCVGQGGMGSVYLAEHIFISNDRVAIKVINAEMVNDYTRERLDQEARLLVTLTNNDNIVKFRNYHIDENNNIYLLMEYVEGQDLNEYIHHTHGLIVEDDICDLFCPILDALGYAHQNEIIHRDIKPSNIIITPGGSPKVLDFGIATSLKKIQEEQGNYIVGTPAYMSPEQVKGENLDARSDIYSLGVLLFEMLTGKQPYADLSQEIDINEQIIEKPLPRLRDYYRYTSKKIQSIVDKATAKNPNERYQSCEEFKQALINAKPKQRPNIAAFVAVGVLAIAGGAAFYFYLTNSPGKDAGPIIPEFFIDSIPQTEVPDSVPQVAVPDSIPQTEVMYNMPETEENRAEDVQTKRKEIENVRYVLPKPEERAASEQNKEQNPKPTEGTIPQSVLDKMKQPIDTAKDRAKQPKRPKTIFVDPNPDDGGHPSGDSDSNWQKRLKWWTPKYLPKVVVYEKYSVSGKVVTITYKVNKTIYDFDTSELNDFISQIESVSAQAQKEVGIPADYRINTRVLDRNNKKLEKKQ